MTNPILKTRFSPFPWCPQDLQDEIECIINHAITNFNRPFFRFGDELYSAGEARAAWEEHAYTDIKEQFGGALERWKEAMIASIVEMDDPDTIFVYVPLGDWGSAGGYLDDHYDPNNEIGKVGMDPLHKHWDVAVENLWDDAKRTLDEYDAPNDEDDGPVWQLKHISKEEFKQWVADKVTKKENEE